MKIQIPEPCPFCGGKAFLNHSFNTWYVDCFHTKSCKIKPDTWLLSSLPIKQQIKEWNKRNE